jgi:glycosyltransferase involved in cell wall biosynthesis
MRKASVVVPLYNQSSYLGACLDSLWFQEYPEIEIIVVNDCSPDDAHSAIAAYLDAVASDVRSFACGYDEFTGSILRETHSRYPSHGRTIRILTHPRNMGLAAALNTGIKACTGDYCTYVPADDTCSTRMIPELVKALEANEADFSYCDMLIVGHSGRVERKLTLPEYSFERSFAEWYLCGVAKLYKRSLHDLCGYYDETLLAHDHEMFLRFAMAGAKFVHVPMALMNMLDHSDRQVDIHSPDNWSRLLEESKRLVLSARKYLKDQRHAG